MSDRLKQLLNAPPSKLAAEEAVSIMSAAAHYQVYVDGNARHVGTGCAPTIPDKFFSSALLATVTKWLSMLPVRSRPEVALRVVEDELRDQLEPAAEHQVASIRSALEGIGTRVTAIASADRTVSQKLATPNGTRAAPLHVLAANAPSAHTRAKLAEILTRERERHDGEFQQLLNTAVAHRHALARHRGYRTPLEETLSQAGVQESDAAAFVYDSLAHASKAYKRLMTAVDQTAGGGIGNPPDHFSFYLRSISKTSGVPSFSLDEATTFLAEITCGALGIDSEIHSAADAGWIDVTVTRGADAGLVRIDLLDVESPSGARLTVEDASQQQRCGRIGRALCRYYQRGNNRLLTFEALLSLFHEFGHALTQALLREPSPSPTGLRYLPVERLEDLSSWFEKWVFHPLMNGRFRACEQVQTQLPAWQKIKCAESLVSHLEACITSALDLEIHRTTLPVGAIYAHVQEQFDLPGHARVGAFIPYFTSAVLRANPGAGFAYVWGAADGAQEFTRQLASPLPTTAGDSIERYFDPSTPTSVPDPAAAVDFYDRMLQR